MVPAPNKKISAFRIVLVILVISFSSAVVINFVHDITSPIISAKEEERLHNTLQTMMPDAEKFQTKIVEDREVYLGREDEEVVGVVVPGIGEGFATFGDSDVEVLTLFSPDGTIREVTVLDHKQTPGIGDKIEDPEFLAQFENIETEAVDEKIDLLEQIDIISGATVSAEAVVQGVVFSTDQFEELGIQDLTE